MQISLLAPVATVPAAVAAVTEVAERGLSCFWSTQGTTVDALSALAIAGQNALQTDVGTAVVPIQGRHPMVMAQQALTTNEHLGGRLILGLGVSHRPFIETTWGMSYEQPVAQMGEYLDVLLPLLAGEEVSHEGQHWTMRGALGTAGPKPRVFLSALGPLMVDLAGRRTDGVITWLVGPRSLSSITVPALEAGASSEGRDRPELIAGFPVCVTSSPSEARRRAAEQYEGHGRLPTYAKTLEREGAAGPEDLALVGSAEQVRDQIEALGLIGVTGVMVDVFGDESERAATLDLLTEIQGAVVDLRSIPGEGSVAPMRVIDPRE